MDRVFSRAVLVYFSVERRSWPHRDPEAVEAEFGDAALDLVPKIQAIEHEVYEKDLGWATMPYDAAVQGVGALLRERHPELDDGAVEAFMNAFAFDWK